ncbi:phage portal protein [Lysobacter enzymogenes]|nr:phage portal protein [Lysobacter enzymogenes]
MFRQVPPFSCSGGTWISSLLGGQRSAAGPLVNADSALAMVPVQACVTTLSDSVAQLPIELYRRRGEGQRERATDHTLYRVLKHEPNGWQTPFEFKEGSQIDLGLNGNCFSEIVRNGDASVKALIPIQGKTVQLYRAANGQPFYQVDGGELLPARNIHHVRWISRNGYVGIAPVILHRDALGMGMAIRDHASRSFVNGTALSGVLTRPKEATPIHNQEEIERIKGQWQSTYAGSNNSGKVALLQEGMQFTPLAMTNVDSELIAALKLTAADSARIYKIPLHMIGDLDRATFSNIEHQAIQYVGHGLLPWLKRHEEAMMRDFLLPSEREQYYIEFNVAGLMRGDQKSRYESYAIGRQWGWLSVNDIRRLENLPPIEGGGTYLQPMNMVGAGTEVGADRVAQSFREEVARALKQ